jgi:hypothetical protein
MTARRREARGDLSEREAWNHARAAAIELQRHTTGSLQQDAAYIADLADRMLDQLDDGKHVNPRENPPLLIWGNPPSSGLLSKRVYDVSYKHEEDGKDYRHKFAAGCWLFTHDKDPSQVTLWQRDGKPLFEDF